MELLIGLGVAALVGSAATEYISAQTELRRRQADVTEREGHLRIVMDEIARAVRRTGYRVTSPEPYRISAQRDTIELYIGHEALEDVDTIRYYVNPCDAPPSLVKQLNRGTPCIFARGVESVQFVAGDEADVPHIAVVLTSVEPDPQHPEKQRRLGETIPLRNR